MSSLDPTPSPDHARLPVDPVVAPDLVDGIVARLERRDELSNGELDLLRRDLAKLRVQEDRDSVVRFCDGLLASEAPLPNMIGGALSPVEASSVIDLVNPNNGQVIGAVPLGGRESIDEAVSFASAAQEAWRETPVAKRVEVMRELHRILSERKEEMGGVLALENGKKPEEAVAEIGRGIECVETAMTYGQQGGRIFRAGEISGHEAFMPRGVVAGITPFNFPTMIPLWMAPAALVTGNAFILKPSEQTPLSALVLGEAMKEAGVPDGVFSVVNGGREAVEALCDHPDIKALGFVGSSAVAQAVYTRASAAGKAVRALGGAKNPIILTESADPEWAAEAILKSATDCAGQRCMAASVLLAVGNVDKTLERLQEKMEALVPGVDMGALISKGALLRNMSYLEKAEIDGYLQLDGRKAIPERDSGFYLGPSIIMNPPSDYAAACEEIFGPTLTVIQVGSLDEALDFETRSQYGNAASILTDSLREKEYFLSRVGAGMVGVNIPVPVPSEPRAFGGTRMSLFGDGGLTGSEAFRFWTEQQKITERAPGGVAKDWTS